MRTGLARDLSEFKRDFEISFLNSNKLYESESIIKTLNIDVGVCIDWTKDFFMGFSDEFFKVIHVHPSLLPFYRGYGAITEQFLQGVIKSGLTVVKNSQKVDAGDILYQKEIEIDFNDSPIDFIDKYTTSSVDFIQILFTKGLDYFKPITQNEDMGFYLVRKRNKNAIIDFNRDAYSIYNHIRGYSYPFFGAHFYYKCLKYIVFRASIEAWQGNFGAPGTILSVDEEFIDVACGSGKIRLFCLFFENTEIIISDIFEKNGLLNN